MKIIAIEEHVTTPLYETDSHWDNALVAFVPKAIGCGPSVKIMIYKTYQHAQHRLMQDEDNRQEDTERQTKALAGLAFLLALALFGSYLVIHLRVVGKVEDCLLAQRSNCDALLDRP
jgi:hypothetical protein